MQTASGILQPAINISKKVLPSPLIIPAIAQYSRNNPSPQQKFQQAKSLGVAICRFSQVSYLYTPKEIGNIMTVAVVGYMKDEVNFRGVYVHYDGDKIPGILGKWMPEDQDALVAWIEEGLAHGGYFSATEESKTFEAEENLFDDILKTIEVVPYVYLASDGKVADVFSNLD